MGGRRDDVSGLFAGALAGPLLVGVLAEREAFATAWVLLAVIALLAAVTVAASRNSDRPGATL